MTNNQQVGKVVAQLSNAASLMEHRWIQNPDKSQKSNPNGRSSAAQVDQTDGDN